MNSSSTCFSYPKESFPLDVMHYVDHKKPQTLKVLILNINNTISSLETNFSLATLVPAGKCEQVQKVKWLEITQEPYLHKNPKLLPRIPRATNLQLEPNTYNTSKSFQDAILPEIAKKRLQQLLDINYNRIISKSEANISRTNLIELHISTEGPPVAFKPFTVPLKYEEFVEHKIKQLEESGIISRSMSDWASPIFAIPRKEE